MMAQAATLKEHARILQATQTLIEQSRGIVELTRREIKKTIGALRKNGHAGVPGS